MLRVPRCNGAHEGVLPGATVNNSLVSPLQMISKYEQQGGSVSNLARSGVLLNVRTKQMFALGGSIRDVTGAVLSLIDTKLKKRPTLNDQQFLDICSTLGAYIQPKTESTAAIQANQSVTVEDSSLASKKSAKTAAYEWVR